MKSFGMIADPDDRQGIVDWAKYNYKILKTTNNYATEGTGNALERINIPIIKEVEVMLNGSVPINVKFLESRKGGDQQMASLMINGMIDYLIYFWNTQGKEAHDDDIKAVLRQSVNYNIPTACNRNTADHLISSTIFSEKQNSKMKSDYIANIALVAHDKKKNELVDWANSYKEKLSGHNIYATGTTGGLIRDSSGLNVNALKSGPLGGDVEISALILEDKIDYLFFFWDPHTAQPHDVDVKALLRSAIYEDVAVACNKSTAEHLITSSLYPRDKNKR